MLRPVTEFLRGKKLNKRNSNIEKNKRACIKRKIHAIKRSQMFCVGRF